MKVIENILKSASPLWKLSDTEWERLSALLVEPVKKRNPTKGGPRQPNDRAIAEACLFRHFHSLAQVYSSFGWNRLPAEFGVAPSTANNRYRDWVRSRAWVKFWQGLIGLRQGPAVSGLAVSSPVIPILAELERAYSFFNARLFGDSLPWKVALCLEMSAAGRCLGYFSGSRWRLGEQSLDHISLSTAAIGRGAEFALEVLLHEMVHFWNHLLKLKDVSGRNQYHNQHFRDAARLFGLDCPECNRQRRYSATELSPQGVALVREFRPNEDVFMWKAGIRKKASVVAGM